MISGNIVSILSTQRESSTRTTPNYGVVYSVITDETHPIFTTDLPRSTSYIGAVQFRYHMDYVTVDESLPIAFPINPNVVTLPLRNELIDIFTAYDGTHYYRRLGYSDTPTSNNSTDFISKTYDPVESTSVTTYDSILATNIPRVSTAATIDDKYGEYFNTPISFHKLRLYEGDTLIESRFGQSIRFSAYNNPSNEFSPSIIIRNGENALTASDISSSSIDEDINRDNIIGMFSNRNRLPFAPGFIDASGRSNFQTKPRAFSKYPSEFSGDTTVISSDRIIFSSKVNELIFFSKGNYGFISDGAMSIDNRLGITANVGDSINIFTNGFNIAFNTNEGSILLGTDAQHPLVLGDVLVNVLTTLVDAITKMQFLTPSGPTAIGPVNVTQFRAIQRSLSDILSLYNKTS
jgi:hypothetical protein